MFAVDVVRRVWKVSQSVSPRRRCVVSTLKQPSDSRACLFLLVLFTVKLRFDRGLAASALYLDFLASVLNRIFGRMAERMKHDRRKCNKMRMSSREVEATIIEGKRRK